MAVRKKGVKIQEPPYTEAEEEAFYKAWGNGPAAMTSLSRGPARTGMYYRDVSNWTGPPADVPGPKDPGDHRR
jgi:hypothetical protein